MGKEILGPKQLALLEAVAASRELTRAFYFTGGTALAAFYLNHRESEDLDFFSLKEVEPLAIEAFFKSQKKRLGFKAYEFQRSFNRNIFFLHYARGTALKAEFTYFPFPPLGRGKRYRALRIDSLRDIAVNKAFTVSQRARLRDFVDLFFILRDQRWTLAALVRDARIKFDARIDPVQLGVELIKVRSLKDMPRMRVPVDMDALAEFFIREAARLKKDILA